MGRPKKPDEERKSFTIKIRVTPEEKKKIEKRLITVPTGMFLSSLETRHLGFL